MQRAGDVRGRNDDAVRLGLGALRPACPKGAGRLPGCINAALDRARNISVLDHRSIASAIARARKPASRGVSTPAAPTAAPFPSKFKRVIGTPTGQALPTPDAGSLHHPARGRRLCEPGAGAGDRFAAAADRERLPNHRGRGRDCAHGLCGYARIHPVRGRPDGRPVREIPHRRDRERACRRARDAVRNGIVAAATRAGAACDRRRCRLGHSRIDGLSRRCDASRPLAADPGALRLRLHSGAAFRAGHGRRARRPVRLAQRLLHARRHVRACRSGPHLRAHRQPQELASEAGTHPTVAASSPTMPPSCPIPSRASF